MSATAIGRPTWTARTTATRPIIPISAAPRRSRAGLPAPATGPSWIRWARPSIPRKSTWSRRTTSPSPGCWACTDRKTTIPGKTHTSSGSRSDRASPAVPRPTPAICTSTPRIRFRVIRAIRTSPRSARSQPSSAAASRSPWAAAGPRPARTTMSRCGTTATASG